VLVLYVFVKIECTYLCFVCTVSDLSPDNASATDPVEEWVAAIDALSEVWTHGLQDRNAWISHV